MDQQIEILKKLIENKVYTTLPKDEEKKWVFDFRNVSLTSEFLDIYTDIFFEKFKGLNNFQVCGLESASISLLSAIVLKAKKMNLNVNGFFIRKSRKKHDLFKQIEGQVQTSAPIIIIDDILNSGSSVFKQVKILKDAGYSPTKVFTIIRFRDKEFYNFLEQAGLSVESLFELNDFQNTLPVKNEKLPTFTFLPLEHKLVWGKKFGDTAFEYVVHKSQPLLDNGKLYFGTDSGIFYCVDSKTAEIVWTKKIFFGDKKKRIFSSPAIHGNMVFFGAYDGNFYCLDKLTGQKIWVNMNADWIGSSPCLNIDQSLVYVGLEYGLWKKNGGIAALEMATGKQTWHDQHIGLTHCSPHHNKKHNLLFCGSNDGILRIYNSKTGNKIREYKFEKEIKLSFAENSTGEIVCFGAFDGMVYFIDTKTLEMVDKFATLEAIYSNQSWENEFVYISSLDKNLYKYDTQKKQLVWKQNLGGRIFSTPKVIGGFVFIGCNDGKVYKIDKKTGEKKGYLQFSERVLNDVVAEPDLENILYIATQANEIYCVELL